MRVIMLSDTCAVAGAVCVCVCVQSSTGFHVMNAAELELPTQLRHDMTA